MSRIESFSKPESESPIELNMDPVPEEVTDDYIQKLERDAPLIMKIQVELAKKYCEDTGTPFDGNSVKWMLQGLGHDFRENIVKDPERAVFLKDYKEAIEAKDEVKAKKAIEEIADILHNPAGIV